MMKWFLSILAVFLLASCQKVEAPDSEAVYTQTIYLVRHAEKEKGNDPKLTEAGRARAIALKDKLKNSHVDYIYSTQTRRTLATAQPLADHLGLDIVIYDGKDLEGFAKELATLSGVHVVVGHSNTTPQLAAILAGGDIALMPETEYDRFIEVKLGESGETAQSTTRFGQSL